MNVSVVVKRDHKGKIIYHSGLVYVDRDLEVDGLENHHINFKEPTGPKKRGEGTYCPYCKTWNKWAAPEDYYKMCPICTISMNDFYVKKYNHLWGK